MDSQDLVDFSQYKILMSAKIDYSIDVQNSKKSETKRDKEVDKSETCGDNIQYLIKSAVDNHEKKFHMLEDKMKNAPSHEERVRRDIEDIASDVIINKLPKELEKEGIFFKTEIKTEIEEIHEDNVDIHFFIKDLVVTQPHTIFDHLPYNITRNNLLYFEALTSGINKMCTKAEEILTKVISAIHLTGIKVTGIKVGPFLIDLEIDNKKLKDCDFNKMSEKLYLCAKLVEDNLKKSGAVLGPDYTKLDCFSLGMELMINCYQLSYS